MIKALRQFFLRLTVGLLKLIVRPTQPGWVRSQRRVDLQGR